MDFKKGVQFKVAFKIDGRLVPCATKFLGKVMNIGEDKVYLCQMVKSGTEVGFTQPELDTFSDYNDPSKIEEVDFLTMG